MSEQPKCHICGRDTWPCDEKHRDGMPHHHCRTVTRHGYSLRPIPAVVVR